MPKVTKARRTVWDDKDGPTMLRNPPVCDDSIFFKKPAAREISRKAKMLIQLYHTARCQEKNCTLPYCDEFKKLWTHLQNGCRKKECEVSHCCDAKRVLSHHHRCMRDRLLIKHEQCKVCKLVRDAKAEAIEKQKAKSVMSSFAGMSI